MYSRGTGFVERLVTLSVEHRAAGTEQQQQQQQQHTDIRPTASHIVFVSGSLVTGNTRFNRAYSPR
jgi:hypothetical protein